MIGGAITQLVHRNYQVMKDRGTPKPNTDIMLPVTYAVFSALFGTQSVVQIKCVAAMLSTALMNPDECNKFIACHAHPNGGSTVVCGPDIWNHWFLYLSLLVWIAFVAVWLYRLNEALSK